jgi:anthranilate synthase/aminodeoxychorismate synthase-like glutamine amidotransferase
MIAVIDNYDSFTYNLVQLMESLSDEPIEVLRNDAFAVEALLQSKPRAIVISPGPGTPANAGRCVELIRKNETIPLLGVCLGHQAIGEAYGGRVGRGPIPVHGKASEVHHQENSLFQGCPMPMRAARYHSLVIHPESLPQDLQVDAMTKDGIIMAVSHRSRPVYGIQFHPESYGTPGGPQVMKNFLRMAGLA